MEEIEEIMKVIDEVVEKEEFNDVLDEVNGYE